MKRVAFAVPGDIDTPTGGYAYDKRIMEELRALGWHVDLVNLGATFPAPDDATRASALAKLQTITAGQPIVIDGLAYGVMAEETRLLRESCPLVALVHHPLALETGLDGATMQALKLSEQAALAHAREVIATSAPTVDILCREYAVPAARIAVVPPGVDRPPPRPRGLRHDDRVHLLAVGSIVPRKGYDQLIEALGQLKHLHWRLTIAGDVTRSDAAFAQLQSDIARFGLEDRVVVTGAVKNTQLEELYRDADIFVLASHFEGYGMVFGEAIAHGLPVVATTVGAALEIVPPGAGLLVPPGQSSALRDAVWRVIVDAELRCQMAEAAREAATRLPQWRDQALLFAGILERLK